MFLLLIICMGIIIFSYFQLKPKCPLNHFPEDVDCSMKSLNPTEKFTDLKRLVNNYGPFGPLMTVTIGSQRFYVVTSEGGYGENYFILPIFIIKSNDYMLFQRWIGNGLLISTGKLWRHKRKIITPMFNFKILEDFIPVFNSFGNILIEKLSEKVEQIIDIYPFITLFTLDVIYEAAMGVTVNAQRKSSYDYVKAINKLSTIFVNRTFSSWKEFDSLQKFASEYNEHEECLKIIHNFTKSIIEMRRKKLFNDTNQINLLENELDDDIVVKRKPVFLDIILMSQIDGQSLSNEAIEDEVNTFIIEGHHTVASAVGFIIFEIGKDLRTQDKLIMEMREIFADDEYREATLYDLNNMKYLDYVIRNALALYPSIPFFARKLDQDTIFRQKFAFYEIKCILSKIIRNFELLPLPSKYDPVLSSEMMLKSSNGIQVYLKSRF